MNSPLPKIVVAWMGVCLFASVVTAHPGVEHHRSTPQRLQRLDPLQSEDGVHRAKVEVLAEGINVEAPAVTVHPSGAVWAAYIEQDDGKERLWLKHAKTADAHLEHPVLIFEGARAWHPRMAAGPNDEVWIAWCGREIQHSPIAREDHRRDLFLQRIAPDLGHRVQINTSGRHCDPDLAVDGSGRVHVAWEASNSPSLQSDVVYAVYDRDHMTNQQTLSSSQLARRPSIAISDSEVAVTWDELVSRGPTSQIDPDYDIAFAVRSLKQPSSWRKIAIDNGLGTQAAPTLMHRQKYWWVVYHSTSPSGGLLKHWVARRVSGKGIVEAYRNRALQAFVRPPKKDEASENQGAEFPCIAQTSSGSILIASRPSQGALVHVLRWDRLSKALDITRAPIDNAWGARGIKCDAAVFDNKVLLVRRARQEIVLERFDIDNAPSIRAAREGRTHDTLGSWTKVKPEPKAITPYLPSQQLTYKGMRVLFGDVHMHSALSDGTGAPDEIYARAWVRGLDFAALTDHDYIVGSKMTMSEHDEISWLTDFFNTRPGFTALHAYEWTTPATPKGSGHRNVYFKAYAPTPVYGFKDGYADTQSLQRALKNENAFTAPHHTGWTGTDWNNADDAIQRHFEIVSVHGEFEHPSSTEHRKPAAGVEPSYAQDGLRQGHVFGFLGGSDAHGLVWHHGIARRANPWEHGLTGVLYAGDQVTREKIWDALYKRHTFATSGHRAAMVLSTTAGLMGDHITTSSASVPLTVQVLTGDGVLEIISEAKTVFHQNAQPGLFNFSWSGKTNSTHFYARLCKSGECVWTSPIFVQHR